VGQDLVMDLVIRKLNHCRYGPPGPPKGMKTRRT
jgi:hypothetical protein